MLTAKPRRRSIHTRSTHSCSDLLSRGPGKTISPRVRTTQLITPCLCMLSSAQSTSHQPTFSKNEMSAKPGSQNIESSSDIQRSRGRVTCGPGIMQQQFVKYGPLKDIHKESRRQLAKQPDATIPTVYESQEL